MIILLNGEDTFRSRMYLKKMIAKFKQDRDPQGLNVSVLDCTKEEPGVIIENILAMPFLAEKKMIVLENLISATKKQELQENILNKVKDNKIPETNIIIFWEDTGKPKTNVSKELLEILNKEKFSQTFDLLTGTKLSTWIAQEITERGGKIEKRALNFICENIGTDVWTLNSLIDQLVAYKGSLPCQGEGQEGVSQITLPDVELFLENKIDDNIFNLVDCIVNGQTKKAFEMIRAQYQKGEDSHYILAMILRQFRILLELRDLYEKEDKLTSDQIAKKLTLHPFVVKKSLPMIKRFTLAQLKKIYNQLLEIDVKTKTGHGDQSLMLDFFVGKITS